MLISVFVCVLCFVVCCLYVLLFVLCVWSVGVLVCSCVFLLFGRCFMFCLNGVWLHVWCGSVCCVFFISELCGCVYVFVSFVCVCDVFVCVCVLC